MCIRYGSLDELNQICILLKDVAKAMTIRQKGNPQLEQLVKDLEALQQASKSALSQYATKKLSREAEHLVIQASGISGGYYMRLSRFLEQMRAQRRYFEMETHINDAKMPPRCCYCRFVSWITRYRSRALRQEMKEDNRLYEQIVAHKPRLERMLEIWSLPLSPRPRIDDQKDEDDLLAQANPT